MDSDEVNSISDTVESNQVALLLKSVFYDCSTELGLEEQEKLFELTASGDTLKPVLMTLPTNVMNLYSVKYNTKLSTESFPNYKEIQFLPFDAFLEMQQGKATLGSMVHTMTYTINSELFETIYTDDAMPTYYTSISGQTLIFDSYLVTEDSTLQKSKTMCKGLVYPEFLLENNFIPQFNPDQFSYWINRAKVRAFAELKQAPNQEASSETRNQKVIFQKRKRRVAELSEFDKLPKYGRTSTSNVLIPDRLKQGN